MTSRRTTLAWLAVTAGGTADEKDELTDESFRYRWQSIEALYFRAKKDRVAQVLTLSEYKALIRLLREEEQAIFAAAATHRFGSVTEHNVWHRGKLKFPSQLQAEIRLLAEGKDPAFP